MPSDFNPAPVGSCTPVQRRLGYALRPLARRARRGFALIVTLALMTLLLLLVLTLTTLVRINMITASNNLVTVQARQNALLAAYIGIGQLQKFAGPDQRTTTTAYLGFGGETPLSGFQDNSVAFAQPADQIYGNQSSGTTNTETLLTVPITTGGTWYWTGVWGPGVNPLAMYTGYGTSYNGTANAKAPEPLLLNWLVSGDESVPLSSNFSKNGVVGPPGTNGTLVPFTPDTGSTSGITSPSTNNNQYDWTATTNDITILPKNPTALIKATGQPAALLVGPNTAGTSINTVYNLNRADGSLMISMKHDFNVIVAPIITINNVTPTGAAPFTSGRYAFWVGDEGVKAKYTPIDPYAGQTKSTIAGDGGQPSRYNFWAPLRSAIERLDPSGIGFNTTIGGYSSISGATLAPNTSSLSPNNKMKQLLEPSQILFIESNLVGGGNSNTQANKNDPEQALQQHYFDMTTSSYGVIADSLRGGLRYDLTTAFHEIGTNGLTAAFKDPGNGLNNRTFLPGSPSASAAAITATTEPNVVSGSANGQALNFILGPGAAGNFNPNPFHGPNAPPPPGVGTNANIGGLRWNMLENFYNTGTSNNGTAASNGQNAVQMQPGNTTHMGITPLITQVRLRFGQFTDSVLEQYVSVQPIFVLANPYTFPITDQGGGLDLGFRINTRTVPPGYSNTTTPAQAWDWPVGLEARNDDRGITPGAPGAGYGMAFGYDYNQFVGLGGTAGGANAYDVSYTTTSFGSGNSASGVPPPGYYAMVKDNVDFPPVSINASYNSALDHIAFHIDSGANSTFQPGEAKVFSLNRNGSVTLTQPQGNYPPTNAPYLPPQGKIVANVGGYATVTGSQSFIEINQMAPVSLAAVSPNYEDGSTVLQPLYMMRDTGTSSSSGKAVLYSGTAMNATTEAKYPWPDPAFGYISTVNPGVAFTLELRLGGKNANYGALPITGGNVVLKTGTPGNTTTTGIPLPGQNVLTSIVNMDLTGAGLYAQPTPSASSPPDPRGYAPPYTFKNGYRRQYLGTGSGFGMPVFLTAYYSMLALPGNLGGGTTSVGGFNNTDMLGFYVNPSEYSGTTNSTTEGWFDPSDTAGATSGGGGYLAFRVYNDFNLRATNMALPPFASFNNPWPGGVKNPVYNNLSNNITSYMTVPPYGRIFDSGPGWDDTAVTGTEDKSFTLNSLGGPNHFTGAGGQDDVAWGYSNNGVSGITTRGQQFVTLYGLPQRGTSATETVSGLTVPDVPIMSLGQLTDADFTADDVWTSVGYQPGHAFGNSYFSPYVTRGSTIQTHPNLSATKVMVTEPTGAGGAGATYLDLGTGTTLPTLPVGANANAYDVSYIMNVNLWDRYFFSTLVPSLAPNPANSRMTFAAGYSRATAVANIGSGTAPVDPATGLATFVAYTPARFMMIDGAFNINSTSWEAWRAILSAMRGVALTPSASGTGTGGTETYFPRAMPSNALSLQTSGGTAVNTPVNPSNQTSGTQYGATDLPSYAGFRQLTDNQIDILAAKIVQQVHQRGPFLSLAQFVNRDLHYPYTGGSADVLHGFYSVSGPLQAAIDMDTGGGFTSFNSFIAGSATGSNSPQDSKGGLFIPYSNTTSSPNTGGGPTAIYPDAGLFTTGFQPYAYSGTTSSNNMANPNSVLTGIPGWLTQADLLQALAPILSARSDTFTVRSYGEVLNPSINQNSIQTLAPTNQANPITSDPTAVLGRAWCEVVVQRMPDYIANDPKSMNEPACTTGYGAPNPGKSTGETLSTVNAYFGRRFRIVSIRWLTADDI